MQDSPESTTAFDRNQELRAPTHSSGGDMLGFAPCPTCRIDPMELASFDDLLTGREGLRGKDFNMRWVASMVADVHRILTRGGIFSYPLDSKCAHQGGKLRLMYEANPMSLLVEQAGGAASTGRVRMLEVQPSQLHQRVPVFLGSRNEVEAAIGYHRDFDARLA